MTTVSGVFGRRAFVPQEFQGNETREGVVSDRRTVFIILQSQPEAVNESVAEMINRGKSG
ncbi:hypothetical protein LNP26_26280 [Klebsiella variicola subsp. variicola]|nr:hypothetical protein [Klebsiella variicola subsp. variicola]